jgi:nucleoside phosphorylase
MGFFESEVGVAVAATAALASPRVRAVMRRGAVYGLAGVLKAGDMVGSAARGVAAGMRVGEEEAAPEATEPTPARRTPASSGAKPTAAKAAKPAPKPPAVQHPEPPTSDAGA